MVATEKNELEKFIDGIATASALMSGAYYMRDFPGFNRYLKILTGIIEQAVNISELEKEALFEGFSKGDLVKVIKSKYIKAGSIVEILEEIQPGIYLVGMADYSGTYVVVEKNLKVSEE